MSMSKPMCLITLGPMPKSEHSLIKKYYLIAAVRLLFEYTGRQKSHAKDLMIKEGEYRFGDFIVRANE